MAKQNQLLEEIELETNPSYIIEKNGIFYPVERISWDRNNISMEYNRESELELGLDITETPTKALTLTLESDSNLLRSYKIMIDEIRNLAQISLHDFYSVQENSIMHTPIMRLYRFKPRLFRRVVNN